MRLYFEKNILTFLSGNLNYSKNGNSKFLLLYISLCLYFILVLQKLKTESLYAKEMLIFQYPSGNRFNEEFTNLCIHDNIP